MLLDELKLMIKEFETVLVKDERFKDDASFKNQVKIIYSKEKKSPNIMAPILLGNLSSVNNTDEITKLKNRIKYLEKIENMPCKCEEREGDSLFATEPFLDKVKQTGKNMLERTTIQEDLQTVFDEMGDDSIKLHAMNTDDLVDFLRNTSFNYKKEVVSKIDGKKKLISIDKFNSVPRDKLKEIVEEFKRKH
jgi:hypothetical protein